jgi:hypothetical protein
MERKLRIKKIRKQSDLPRKIIDLGTVEAHQTISQFLISEDIKALLIGILSKIMEVFLALISPEIKVLGILIVTTRINA